MIMYKRPLVALMVGLLAATSFGADREVEKLLARMREVYSGTKTARMVIKTTGPRFGKSVIVTELTYMKERKIFARLSGFESLKGRTRTFISDGQRVSVDDFNGNFRYRDFDLDFIPMPVNLEAMSFWDWKRQLSTSVGSNMHESTFRLRKEVPWNNKNWIVLEEKAEQQKVSVDYFIDPKTALIYRVLVYDYNKKTLTTETVLTKLERNIKVDGSLFKVKKAPAPSSVRTTVEKRIKF